MTSKLIRIFSGAAMLLLPFCATAQNAVFYNAYATPHTMPHKGNGITHYAKPDSRNGRTASTGSRLIAVAEQQYADTSYIMEDSIAYGYNGNRGGYLTRYGWEWDFDTTVSYLYFPTGTSYTNGYKNVQTFDANGNVTMLVAQDWNATTSTWTNSFQIAYVYDAMNNRIATKQQSWQPGTSSWDSLFRFTVTYDAAHNLLTELDEEWSLLTSTWVPTDRYTNTYDAANNWTGQLTEQWVNGAWENERKMTFVYDAANNMLNETGQQWNAATSAWVNAHYYLYGNFTGHQPGTIIYQDWNGSSFDNYTQEHYTFNSYGQPETYYREHWTTASASWAPVMYDPLSRYYYDTYTTATPVLSSGAAEINVYPVPATSELTVAISWKTPQAFTLTLTDMRGRVYMSEHMPAQVQYKETLPVANIPAGNYTLQLESAGGKTAKKITIVK